MWNVLPGIKKLDALTTAEIGPTMTRSRCAICVQHQNFNRIAQVTVIKLIVANAMESHRRIRRHHEIGRTRWPAIKKWCGSPSGAIRWLLINVTRTKPHVAWGSSLSTREPLRHSNPWSFEFEHRTSNIERPISNRAHGHRT